MTGLRLKRNWVIVVRRAWSVRFMALAFVFTMAEVMLPFFSEQVPQKLFALLSGVAVAGAFLTRLIAQREVAE